MIRSSTAHMHVAALSHPGMSGKNNEDRFAVSSFTLNADDPRPVLFAVVADGIGGHRAGEVAAELAVNYISQGVGESNGKKPLKALENSIHEASQAIAAHSASKSEQEGMGSTCACAWILDHELYISHVGDSRIYLIRGARIRRLTVDHTWVQEAIEKGIISPEQARDHPNVHVIRRYLGSVHLPEVDFRMYLEDEEDDEEAIGNQGYEMEPGDVVLLCSDGLTDLVWDDEILQTMRSKTTVKAAAEALVDLANQRGGHDNITVVLIAVPRARKASNRKKNLLDWLFGEE
jgi:serine/threonine protein phosphatase PrpC